MKKYLSIICCIPLFLTGCGETTRNFEGISFADETIVYDGQTHTITVQNLPEGATVTYSGQGPFADVGTYPMTATVEAAGYNLLELNATLTITPASFEGVVFEDTTISYDGLSHTIEATGLPSYATVTYTNNGPFTEEGTYEMSALVQCDNYNDLSLDATLTITKGVFNDSMFMDKTVPYDGMSHTIEVVNAPADATITYSNNGPFVEIGEYEISVTIEAEHYTTATKTATLTITKGELNEVTFVDQSIGYDGATHTLEVENLPEGASVTYTNNGPFTEVGTYEITALVQKENYNDKTLTATLTINKGTITGVTFADGTFKYNGGIKRIYVSGAPRGATVTYENNGQIEIGEYIVTAKVSRPNYEDLVLTAKLTIELGVMNNVTFPNRTYSYKPEGYTPTLNNLPYGATVSFDVQTPLVAIGRYEITATVTCPNYEDKTLTAVYLINPASFASNVTMYSDSFEYDGVPHSLKVQNLPANASVTYTSDVPGVTNKATDIGTYNITATVSAPNYQDKVIEATLTISEKKSRKYMAVDFNDVIYFKNPLDNDYLYAMKLGEPETLQRVTTDEIGYVRAYDNQVYYTTKALMMNSFYSTHYNLQTNNVETENLRNMGQVYYPYYPTDIFVGGSTGLFRSSNNNGSAITYTALTSSRASYNKASQIAFCGGQTNNTYKIFYTFDDSQSWIFGMGNNILSDTTTKISYNSGYTGYQTYGFDSRNCDWAIDRDKYFYYDDLYYGVSRYDMRGGKNTANTQGGFVRMTTDHATDLFLYDGYLYYIKKGSNSSTKYGTAICRVSASYGSSSAGEVLIDGNGRNIFSGLTIKDGYLYYCDTSTKGLMKVAIGSWNNPTNLLANYDKTQFPVINNVVANSDPYASVTKYRIGSTYIPCVIYRNSLDENKLYRYNCEDDYAERLTTVPVHSFIVGDAGIVFCAKDYKAYATFIGNVDSTTPQSVYYCSNIGGGVSYDVGGGYNVYQSTGPTIYRTHWMYALQSNTSTDKTTIVYNSTSSSIHKVSPGTNYSDKDMFFLDNGVIKYISDVKTVIGSQASTTVYNGARCVDIINSNKGSAYFVEYGEGDQRKVSKINSDGTGYTVLATYESEIRMVRDLFSGNALYSTSDGIYVIENDQVKQIFANDGTYAFDSFSVRTSTYDSNYNPLTYYITFTDKTTGDICYFDTSVSTQPKVVPIYHI